MRVDPELARLRRDPSGLFCASDEASDWRRGPGGARLCDELALFGKGALLADCPSLRALTAGKRAALRIARNELGGAMAMLRRAPLALYSARHFTNGVMHSLTIAASGRASLSLALIDGAAWQATRVAEADDYVAFQPGELHAAVLAGNAEARLLRNRSDDPLRADITSQPLSLAPGVTYACDGGRESLAFDRIAGGLVTLRLHRRSDGATPARQYRRATGALVHQAAGEQRDSRAQMIMAVLRAMQRSDAAPELAALSRAGEAGARWQALRECLALDSGIGFTELTRVAADPTDPLRAPASALADGLARRHPAFAAAREVALCPA